MFARDRIGYRAALALTVAVAGMSVSPAAFAARNIAHRGQFHQTLALEFAGRPCTGPVDLQITMFDAPVGGTALGTTQELLNVQATDGFGTAELAFGANLFDGKPRWLEVGVRPSKGFYTGFW